MKEGVAISNTPKTISIDEIHGQCIYISNKIVCGFLYTFILFKTFTYFLFIVYGLSVVFCNISSWFSCLCLSSGLVCVSFLDGSNLLSFIRLQCIFYWSYKTKSNTYYKYVFLFNYTLSWISSKYYFVRNCV